MNSSGTQLRSRRPIIALYNRYNCRPCVFAAGRWVDQAGLLFPATLQCAFFGAMPVPAAARHHTCPFQHRRLGRRQNTNPNLLRHSGPPGRTTFFIRPSAPRMEHGAGGSRRAVVISGRVAKGTWNVWSENLTGKAGGGKALALEWDTKDWAAYCEFLARLLASARNSASARAETRCLVATASRTTAEGGGKPTKRGTTLT